MTRRNAHARIQICKFVTKQTERLTCRSSAWDVVRQKAVKSWGPRRSVFSRSHEKRAKRTNVRGFVHARTSRLYRRRQSELSRTRLYGRSLKLLVIPWHRLKRPSPNIIKGGPTSPAIDPVNTATTIPRRITARETRWPANLFRRIASLLSNFHPLPRFTARLPKRWKATNSWSFVGIFVGSLRIARINRRNKSKGMLRSHLEFVLK